MQASYSARSEWQLMERLAYNTLLRWFVGLGMDGPVWGASTFANNRDRLLTPEVSTKVLNGVIRCKRVA